MVGTTGAAQYLQKDMAYTNIQVIVHLQTCHRVKRDVGPACPACSPVMPPGRSSRERGYLLRTTVYFIFAKDVITVELPVNHFTYHVLHHIRRKDAFIRRRAITGGQLAAPRVRAASFSRLHYCTSYSSRLPIRKEISIPPNSPWPTNCGKFTSVANPGRPAGPLPREAG